MRTIACLDPLEARCDDESMSRRRPALLLAALAVGLGVGCGGNAGRGADDEVTPFQVVERYYAAWGARDEEAVKALIHADALRHLDPGSFGPDARRRGVVLSDAPIRQVRTLIHDDTAWVVYQVDPHEPWKDAFVRVTSLRRETSPNGIGPWRIWREVMWGWGSGVDERVSAQVQFIAPVPVRLPSASAAIEMVTRADWGGFLAHVDAEGRVFAGGREVSMRRELSGCIHESQARGGYTPLSVGSTEEWPLYRVALCADRRTSWNVVTEFLRIVGSSTQGRTTVEFRTTRDASCRGGLFGLDDLQRGITLDMRVGQAVGSAPETNWEADGEDRRVVVSLSRTAPSDSSAGATHASVAGTTLVLPEAGCMQGVPDGAAQRRKSMLEALGEAIRRAWKVYDHDPDVVGCLSVPEVMADDVLYGEVVFVLDAFCSVGIGDLRITGIN